MAMRKNLHCPKCDRTFSMAAHLARHVNSMHGSGRKKKKTGGWGGARTKSTASFGMRRGPGRPPKAKRAWGTRGRGRSATMSLAGLGLEQLQDLMEAAREEARKRLHQLQSLFN